ncbi:DNA-processing protein DprA [Endozoicomonas ascidiicola]|uniref:DNA-processing protein DprA n=1 Tax=Endozoicomonas ascidiicola TaxID=1698521 RepID=UPI0008332342|nr:DNA-processing protein DprA [Endozoicomonas ascidiicola]
MDNVDSLISEHTKAVLLLTAYFNANESRDVKPLTENGYGYFARWLNFHDYKPVDLLDQARFAEICIRWEQSESHLPVKKQVMLRSLDRTIADITVPRLQSLLNRGASMSMALDKWSAAGIWILDRSHDLYPGTIKKKLKDKAPAILFGVGNPALLAQNSVGFVGSRDCQQNDLDATNHYVQQINDAGFQVVSGAAKGIDSHAMLASMNNGNSAVGIVADSLFKNSASSQWRNHLKNGKLALISPFFPESRFSPANAMQRNKYIYLLSQATVVVCSSVSGQGKKSGTWEGAIENLKNDWVPLLVSDHKHPNHAGNQSLLNGGIPKLQSVAQPITLSDTAGSISALISGDYSNHIASSATAEKTNVQQVNLFENTGGEASAQQSVLDIASQDEPLFQEHTSETADTKSDIQMDFITDTHEESSDHTIEGNVHDQNSLTSEQKNLLAMSLIGSFYKQLESIYKQHIEQTGQVYIEFSLIEQNFPEFKFIGKSALDKLLKELVEHKLLARPSPRKKQFCFPDNAAFLARQSTSGKQESQTEIHSNK